MLRKGRIVSEAKAFGKAKGYADGDTVKWIVEVQVAVNKTKAEYKFRIVWEQDIPACIGVEPDITRWQDIPWSKLERKVFKLQKRIYKAACRGDVKTVRKIQKTLIKSWSARCIAVRKVTQDNQGKKTAGVDGVKSLTPKQRLSLVNKLSLKYKTKPTRRIWIPKPGTDEKRPLGIPTIHDRAMQALTKLALEPEWEGYFEPNSYGFRPGRSCQDAIEAIFLAIRYKPKYVLDADIAKCFDRINHKALLEKLKTSPAIRRQIRAWLKAGVMDNGAFFETTEGTPQGGIISPLLANIALHGLETRIKVAFPKRQLRVEGKPITIPSPTVIRYADDFVILHEDQNVVKKCQQIAAEWLKDMGLELKPSKTRIAHTLNEVGEEKPGFNFLGFNIRQFPVGKNHSGKLNGKLLGFKTIIRPSKDSLIRHCEDIKAVIKSHRAAPQNALIGKLNPMIQGWVNYFSTVSSSKTFGKAGKEVFQKLWSWAKRRHPHKPHKWIRQKYWQSVNNDKWRFAVREEGENVGMGLIKHTDTKGRKHIKVQGTRSPFDGDWIYWSTRTGKHPEAPKSIVKLLKAQKGKCSYCGLYFKDGDIMETDHIIPRSKGGKDEYRNLQLLHRHCHDQKTSSDGSLSSMYDKHQFTEEPDEVKVSSPVLKTSQQGDLLA